MTAFWRSTCSFGGRRCAGQTAPIPQELVERSMVQDAGARSKRVASGQPTA